MSQIEFHKYQGTGNDFVMIDDRRQLFDLDNIDLVGKLCHRKFGIGADGVILIRNHAQYDFEMIYFNPDGSQSLCGNGSRCAVMFAQYLGLIDNETEFQAIDGVHKAYIKNDLVHLRMSDVTEIQKEDQDFFVNTGSPHHITFVKDVATAEVYHRGQSIRNAPRYQPQGTNVNFVEAKDGHLKVRTYERGVENETLSCGTGVTAVALVASLKGYSSPVTLETSGGELQVAFATTPHGFSDIFLIGPARKVFSGRFEIG